jgi:uncharacterized protein YjlB
MRGPSRIFEHPGVVSAAVEVHPGDVVLAPVGVGVHGAELEDLEEAVVAADAAQANEHGPR